MYAREPGTPYPQVWHRFAGRRPVDGTVPQYRIQDLTEDQEEEGLALLVEHFVNNEPPCKHIGLRQYPAALAELTNLWRKTMKDRLSLACLEDRPGKPRIVGLNVLTVALKEEKDEPFETQDKIWAMLFGAVDLVTKSVDVFEKYGVDKYLNAYGLVVDPKHSGQGIGFELLKTRFQTRQQAEKQCIPFAKTKFAQRGHSFLGPFVMNKVDPSTRDVISGYKFKKSIHLWLSELGHMKTDELIQIIT